MNNGTKFEKQTRHNQRCYRPWEQTVMVRGAILSGRISQAAKEAFEREWALWFGMGTWRRK